MLVVSYFIPFAFHPDLDIDCVIIERRFGQSHQELSILNYLIHAQLNFKNNKMLLQLRDCVLAIAAKNSKTAISEILLLIIYWND